MLAQFQARYPTGSLITELLTIYQGKFVVRVSAQVDGVTRATGMAAAETLEIAEDRARERSLAVLVIDAGIAVPANAQRQENNDPHPSITSEATATQLARDTMPQATLNTASPLITETNHEAATISRLNHSNYLSVQTSLLEESIPESGSPEFRNDAYSKDLSDNPVASTPANQEPDIAFEFEPISEIQTQSSDQLPSFNNVTPLVPRHNLQASAKASLREKLAEKTVATSEPIDLSDAIARTSVELKRLGWSNQQGREYLEKTYGKRSRQHLNDQELLEFLHYLESLPSP